jgi:quinol-cytochrome oxidoreductase complex cytochrome b subunit
MARADRTPVDEPRERGRLFWICVLVLIEFLVWTILAVAGVSETIATVVALVVGIAFVFAFRERIWGADWRERAAAQRAKRPR